MCKLDKEHCICYLVAWTSQVQKHKTHTACYTHLLKISTKYVSKEKKKTHYSENLLWNYDQIVHGFTVHNRI